MAGGGLSTCNLKPHLAFYYLGAFLVSLTEEFSPVFLFILCFLKKQLDQLGCNTIYGHTHKNTHKFKNFYVEK